MKVLMFGWEFPPYISGGLGTACLGLTRQLTGRDIKITFVLPKIKGEIHNPSMRIVGGQNFIYEEYEEFKKESEVYSKLINVSACLRPYLNDQTYQDYLARCKQQNIEGTDSENFSVDFSGDYGDNLLAEVSRYAIIGRYLAKREDFEIIHAHDWLTFLAGIEAKKVSGKPLVVHVHATEIDRCGDNGNVDIFNIEKYGMEMADKIIAVSYRTKNMIVDHYGIDPNKIFVVHNGVDLDQLCAYDKANRPFKKDKIVLYLGRITMQKGPDYFLEAANLVLQKNRNVRFVMAGSGDMTRRMIERMAELGMVENFHFTGFLGTADREKLFAMSDLYVMPSVSEPFGITPLEAMRYNIPVIISKQSGVAEILDHVIKVDFWDTHRLASCILNVIEKPPLEESLITNNLNIIEKMDWGPAADKVIDVYRNVLS